MRQQPGDLAEAIPLLEEACRREGLKACDGLAFTHVAGLGLRRDAKRGRELWEGTCYRGFAKSCRSLAEHIGFGAVPGPNGWNEAAPWFARFCESHETEDAEVARCIGEAEAYVSRRLVEPKTR